MLSGLTAPPSPSLHVVLTGDAVGGVWTYGLDLGAGLARAGHRVSFLLSGPRPSGAQRRDAAAVQGLKLFELDAPLDWTATDECDLAQAAATLAQATAALGADIVHLNAPALAAFARFEAPVLGVCHSCLATWWRTVKSGEPPADFTWRIGATAHGYVACDRLVAPTHAFARSTAESYRIALPLVAHNGRDRAVTRLHRPREPLVLTVGRLWDEGKDVRTLDRAAVRVAAPVLAVGPLEGPHGGRQAFEHVETTGPLDAACVEAAMARASVFVSSARYEPFGLAVLEAAQAGLPLVLSDIASFRELWSDAAVFVPPGDADAFAAAINGLLGSAEHREAAGQAALDRAQRYGVGAMTERYLTLYADLVGTPFRGHSAREVDL